MKTKKEDCPVKKICKFLNVKQKELSEIIGVSEVTVNRWASGSVVTPFVIVKHFELLEENHILKEKIKLVDLIVSSFQKLNVK
ncbi:MAG: hypothetical protein WC667_13195 [Sulfurimonas sp.]|jgi:transcriptional regulator with XRE-family HTH domain